MGRVGVILAGLSLLLSSAVASAASPSAPGSLRYENYSRTSGEVFWNRATDSDGLVVAYEIKLNGNLIGNRDVLASKFPSVSTGLAAISAPFGLKVQLPMNREEIKIASFDLTAASSREPDASYVMNLLMRNNARHKLRWPAIELTLLDGVGGILVRKVLMPAEYLPNESLIATGLAGSSEQPIRVALKSSTDAPVGYSVSLFYP